jgi:hypothetical protein
MKTVREFGENLGSEADRDAFVASMKNGADSQSPDMVSLLRIFESRLVDHQQLQDTQRRQTVAHTSGLGYEASSYVWGTPKIEFLSSTQGMMSGRLAIALKYLRQTDSPHQIWVDALCINQQDLVEKGQQLQHMERVYSSADGVLVWLGEERPEERKYSSSSSLVGCSLFHHISTQPVQT